MKFLILVLIGFNLNVLQAQELPLYYGNNFLTGYQDHSLKNEELKTTLFQILSGGHVKKEHEADVILPNCNSASTEEASNLKCVEHTALGYNKAREKRAFLSPIIINNCYCIHCLLCR